MSNVSIINPILNFIGAIISLMIVMVAQYKLHSLELENGNKQMAEFALDNVRRCGMIIIALIIICCLIAITL